MDWAWIVMLITALSVETWLLATDRATLSQRARAAGRRYPWLPWLTVVGVTVLLGHFWLGWFW